MFIKSEEVLRWVLPADAHEQAVRSLRDQGFFTTLPVSNYGGRVGGASDAGYSQNDPAHAKELPAAEEELVRRASVVIYARGKRLHFVDVGKESAFRRVIEEHLHHLHRFPVLVRSDGRRLEGPENFTDEKLASFLSD